MIIGEGGVGFMRVRCNDNKIVLSYFFWDYEGSYRGGNRFRKEKQRK
jgi:hypothetical protein